jgi:hypothetical protein
MEEHIRRKQLERIGRPRWRREVLRALPLLRDAFVADYVVVGGGNRRLFRKFPDRCRMGQDRASMKGGIRLWHTRLLDTVYLYQPTE